MNVDAAGLGVGDSYPPRIMGIINVSVESPYDPSVFTDHDEAATHIDGLVADGADIVDVGLASANKRVDVLSVEEELNRLEIAIEAIESASREVIYSIETRYHEVAAAALDGGFDMVNDVCGFADPQMPDVCQEYNVAVVKMASPPDTRLPGAVEEAPWASWRGPGWTYTADHVDMAYSALEQNGFTPKTIIDPGFGVWSAAQTLEDDREKFRRLREFKGHGRPILVSINRKNFLRKLIDRETAEALPVSLGATALAVERGAHVIRTHDVEATRDAAVVGRRFSNERLHEPDLGIRELDVTTPREAKRHLRRIGGDVSKATGTSIRVFELHVTTEVRERLTGLLADRQDAWITPGDTAALLVGTPAAFQELATTAPPGEIGDILRRMAE